MLITKLLSLIVKDVQVKNIFLKDMTKTEIAKAFSNGEFEKTNNFISDNAEWIVIEEDRFKSNGLMKKNPTDNGYSSASPKSCPE